MVYIMPVDVGGILAVVMIVKYLPGGPCGTSISIRDETLEITRKTYLNLGWKLLFDSSTVDNNKVISPLSIMGGLNMLATGAEGDSRNEILKMLTNGQTTKWPEYLNHTEASKSYDKMKNFLSDESNKYILKIVNVIFANESGLETKYQDRIENTISNATIEMVDFQNEKATKSINNYISEKTNGLIDTMYPNPLDISTLAVMISSLYFKAAWPVKFHHMRGCWQNSEGCDKSVQFMSAKFNFFVYRQEKATVIEIPLAATSNDIRFKNRKYRNDMFFQIWLPDKDDITHSRKDKKFQNFIWRRSKKISTRRKLTNARIILPKFTIDFEQDLEELLKLRGVSTIFSEKRDLSPMFDDQLVKISHARHKVKFEVTEDGIEAAGLTSFGIIAFSRTHVYTVNRPFYFAIINRCHSTQYASDCPFSNVPIFVGKMVNPKAL